MATPVVALGVDDTFYDVAALEEAWRLDAVSPGCDFHTRVVAARCAGLHELDARLRASSPPREARIAPDDLLPLPPCDTERCAAFVCRPRAEQGEEPAFERDDPRLFFGVGQPVPHPRDRSPGVQVSLSVLVGDDLFRATAREAARALLGVTLHLDWGPRAPSVLGPALWVGPSLRALERLSLRLNVEERWHEAPALGGPFAPAEVLAYISQHAPLRAGDVVSLGGALPGAVPAPLGLRLTAALPPLLRLTAWTTEGPPPVPWRAV